MLKTTSHIIQDAESIRAALRDSVSRWPGFFYAALETVDEVANVVRLGDQVLSLPPEQWKTIIGGTRNPIGSGVQVTMQTWTHTDGGALWLYYVTVRDTAAIGVRRYGPGQTPTAYIDARFRHRNTTALDLAKFLVTQ